MGTPVPQSFPVYENTKHYCVHMYSYLGGGPADCSQNFVGVFECCVQGNTLNNWLALGFECLSPNELCLFSGTSAQRLSSANGPYDTDALCVADC